MNDGQSLERSVERWMRRKGARFTERRVRMPGLVAEWGWECDVHAVLPRPEWRGLLVAAALLGAVSLPGLALEPLLGVFMGFGAIVLGVVSMGALFASRHVWIEVKDRTDTVRRDVVLKLNGAIADVRAHPSASWVAEEAWIVTRSGFDRDAVSLARQYGIRCFVYQGHGYLQEVV